MSHPIIKATILRIFAELEQSGITPSEETVFPLMGIILKEIINEPGVNDSVSIRLEIFAEIIERLYVKALIK